MQLIILLLHFQRQLALHVRLLQLYVDVQLSAQLLLSIENAALPSGQDFFCLEIGDLLVELQQLSL
ncbi:hypothetical protein EAO28_03735 [Klebsiella pneumoniae]|uniref:Uncharacterized protein n=1 Tax=Klebsiella pneumoniae TaxID=573 RepID=A0A3P2EJ25_KLEPN|nr:hypothetical protein EAO28_03735 [Klebsiella pneumoniae]